MRARREGYGSSGHTPTRRGPIRSTYHHQWWCGQYETDVAPDTRLSCPPRGPRTGQPVRVSKAEEWIWRFYTVEAEDDGRVEGMPWDWNRG